MKNNLNLIDSRERVYKRQKRREHFKKILPESIFVTLMLFLLVGFKLMNYSAQNQLENLNRQLEQTGEMAVVFENLEHEEKMLEYYQKILRLIEKENPVVGEKTSAIYQVLPENTRLISIEYENSMIRIAGQTKEQAAIKGLGQDICQKIGTAEGEILSVERLDDWENGWWEFTMQFEIGEVEGEDFA